MILVFGPCLETVYTIDMREWTREKQSFPTVWEALMKEKKNEFKWSQSSHRDRRRSEDVLLRLAPTGGMFGSGSLR